MFGGGRPVALAAIIACIAIVAGALCGTAWAEFPKLELEPVSTGELAGPIGLTNAADGSGRMFVFDQRGVVSIILNDSLLPVPFLDIESKLVTQRANFDERGLLGFAFHPDYAADDAPGRGKFYVYYSGEHPDADPDDPVNPINHRSVIAEYSVSQDDPNVADATSERILLMFDQPQFNHDAGQIAFGPDGMLYIATGDGGGGGDDDPGHTAVIGNAQDRTNLLGNILRIDPFGTNGPGGQYGIPADNPFVGAGGGIRGEIYAYGLRNPWRFSFDDGPGGTGRLFVADVGQGLYEEVNIVTSGGNYGWRKREGLHLFAGEVPDPGVPLIDPIAEYSHPGAPDGVKIGTTVIGGYVYRGSAIPEMVGRYIFADWSTGFASPGNGTLLGLEESEGGAWSLEVLDVVGGNPVGKFIVGLGEDEAGELYVVTRTALGPGPAVAGGIHRIKRAPVPADVNGDGCVNVSDLLTIRNLLGLTGSEIVPPEADVSPSEAAGGPDGIINIADLLFVRNSLGTGSGCM